MSWVFYATVAAAALAAADVCVKMAAGRLPNSLGTLIYGTVAFAVGLTWFLAERARGEMGPASTAGIVAALGVGIAFSTVTVTLYGAFRAGAPLSITSPLVRLAGLLVASLFGVILWNEPLTPRYIVGLSLAVTGVYLIVTR